MTQHFKRGAKVAYRTPRGAQEGYGRVVDIHFGLRGLWYEIKDRDTGAYIKLRAASLSLI